MRKLFLLTTLPFFAAISGLGSCASPDHDSAVVDPLAARGYSVTSGAAPGYVDDRACAECHEELARDYQQVAMAQSFYRPSAEKAIEDFASVPFFHQASGRYYSIERSGDDYTFRRYLLDEAGQPIHQFEVKVDWILGSGKRSRTYLYRTAGGELYQLPLAWYADQSSAASGYWAMAPGYDRPDHQGVTRRVRRECMFCHNAYPDVAAGSDHHGAAQTYPEVLPQGIGCQRCHGPGAEHTRAALAGERKNAVRTSIVNPAKLEPARRDDICFGCHMQPSVALPGIRQFGRGDYSFRPGEALSSYQLQVDVDEVGRARSERFEINHHPYRLRQSRCFVASEGALSCLTCHDPHRVVPAEQRARHYAQACLGCHLEDDCSLDAMASASDDGIDPTDCVACHMPRRRSQDVVHAVVTDHWIRRQPGGPELTAPRAEREPTLSGVELLPDHRRAAGPDADLYRAVAAVRIGSGSAIDFLETQLSLRSPEDSTPYLDLASAQLLARRFSEAEATLDGLLALNPDHPRALSWKGICRSALGDPSTALVLLRQSVAIEPDRPEGWFNLGRTFFGLDRHAEAIGTFQRALELRENHAASHDFLARSLTVLGRGEEAESHRRRALEIEPSF